MFKKAEASSLVFIDERGIEFHINIDKIVKIYDINNNEVNVQNLYFSRGKSLLNNNSRINNPRDRNIYVKVDTQII